MAQDTHPLGYRIRPPSRSRGPIRRFGRATLAALKTGLLFDTLLYPYGWWRHRHLLGQAQRTQSHTYTCFLRSPAQLQALVGPVLRHLAGGGPAPERLRILAFACSNGAEAYTLAAILLKTHPALDFHIEASDLHPEMVEQATRGRYPRDEVLQHGFADSDFVAEVFDEVSGQLVVKPAVRARVSFSCADLAGADLAERFAPADIVLAQNVLFHLDPATARAAFARLVALLKPRAALFVEGMDLDLKLELTQAHRLRPLADLHRRIYAQSRRHIGADWWNYYYGAEPYSLLRRDRVRRYASIFLK